MTCSLKCIACGKRITLDIWAMCLALNTCYHCGANYTPETLNTLVKMAVGTEPVGEEMP